MAMETRGHLIPRPPIQTKVYLLLMLGGFLMIVAALATLVVVATVAVGVFDNPKTVRDAAAAGESLLANQGDLFAFPLWVKPFKLLGLAFMWVAIITVLWAIRRTIREALAPSMREGLPLLLQERRRPNEPIDQGKEGDDRA
ncbi:MAG: hypothetical protein ACE5IZ_11050 [Dehalococcoidia bacterium]